jgi:hypothetical protein
MLIERQLPGSTIGSGNGHDWAKRNGRSSKRRSRRFQCNAGYGGPCNVRSILSKVDDTQLDIDAIVGNDQRTDVT